MKNSPQKGIKFFLQKPFLHFMKKLIPPLFPDDLEKMSTIYHHSIKPRGAILQPKILPNNSCLNLSFSRKYF